FSQSLNLLQDFVTVFVTFSMLFMFTIEESIGLTKSRYARELRSMRFRHCICDILNAVHVHNR
ncbi:hypothetical protein L9F63_017919, partial [Diploptera punctata]